MIRNRSQLPRAWDGKACVSTPNDIGWEDMRWVATPKAWNVKAWDEFQLPGNGMGRHGMGPNFQGHGMQWHGGWVRERG